MKQIILITGVFLTCLNASTAYALEGKYVSSDFNTTTYTTRCVTTESQKAVFKVGQVALNATATNFSGLLFPKASNKKTIIAEMKASIKNRRSVDKYLQFIDQWVAETEQENNSTLSMKQKSYTPRGYLVFYGGSKSFGALKSIGASTNLVLIMIPNCQTSWSKQSGKVIREQVKKIDFKIAVNPSIGAGKKIGLGIAQSRLGIGFIFDPNHNLNKAADFFGAGVSASKSNVLGNLSIAGKYLKAGTVVNLKLNYFPFIMAGKAMGTGTEAISNFGGVSFLDLSFLTNAFIKLTESEVKKLNKEVKASFNNSLKELQKQNDITKTKSND